MIAPWVLQLLIGLVILWLVLCSIVLLDYVAWLLRRHRMLAPEDHLTADRLNRAVDAARRSSVGPSTPNSVAEMQERWNQETPPSRDEEKGAP